MTVTGIATPCTCPDGKHYPFPYKPVLGFEDLLKILTALVVLILLVLIVNNLLLPLIGPKVVFETPPPEVPSHMYTLKATSRGITEEQALDISSKIFNISDELEPPTLRRSGWRFREGEREVEIYESGKIWYFDTSDWGYDMYQRGDFPSDTECRETAEQFLEKLMAKGLTLQSLDLSFNDIDYGTGCVSRLVNGTWITEPYIHSIYVNFAPSYDGIRLYGEGAGFRVTLGKGGKITEFVGNFWEVEPYEWVKISTPEEAVKKLKLESLNSKVVVESIELVYKVSWFGFSKYVKPVYKINIAHTLEDGDVVRYSKTVSASTQEPWLLILICLILVAIIAVIGIDFFKYRKKQQTSFPFSHSIQH